MIRTASLINKMSKYKSTPQKSGANSLNQGLWTNNLFMIKEWQFYSKILAVLN